MSAKPVKFFYLRDKLRTPVACVATQWSADGNLLYVGLSTWNPSDRFSKKEARLWAEKRLLSGDVLYTKDFLHGKNIKLQVINWINITHGAWRMAIPTRTKHAARLWMKNYKPLRFEQFRRFYDSNVQFD